MAQFAWAGLILVVVRENPQHFLNTITTGAALVGISTPVFLQKLSPEIFGRQNSSPQKEGGKNIKPVTWFALTIITDDHSLGTERNITLHFKTLYLYILDCNLNLEENQPRAD